MSLNNNIINILNLKEENLVFDEDFIEEPWFGVPPLGLERQPVDGVGGGAWHLVPCQGDAGQVVRVQGRCDARRHGGGEEDKGEYGSENGPSGHEKPP